MQIFRHSHFRSAGFALLDGTLRHDAGASIAIFGLCRAGAVGIRWCCDIELEKCGANPRSRPPTPAPRREPEVISLTPNLTLGRQEYLFWPTATVMSILRVLHTLLIDRSSATQNRRTCLGKWAQAAQLSHSVPDISTDRPPSAKTPGPQGHFTASSKSGNDGVHSAQVRKAPARIEPLRKVAANGMERLWSDHSCFNHRKAPPRKLTPQGHTKASGVLISTPPVIHRTHPFFRLVFFIYLI